MFGLFGLVLTPIPPLVLTPSGFPLGTDSKLGLIGHIPLFSYLSILLLNCSGCPVSLLFQIRTKYPKVIFDGAQAPKFPFPGIRTPIKHSKLQYTESEK